MDPKPFLRVAGMQCASSIADVASNVSYATSQVLTLTDRQIDLFVFPELFLCGYDLEAIQATPSAWLVTQADGELHDTRLYGLSDVARSMQTTIFVGAAVRYPSGRLTNSVVGLFADGDIRIVYDKQHLWHSDEQSVFDSGSGPALVAIRGWQVGLGICYDMCFADHAGHLALDGALAYICPSAYITGNEQRAYIYLAARALENTIYAGFINSTGGPSNRLTAGGSTLFGPDGSAVRQAVGAGTESLIADLHLAEIHRMRSFLRMLDERRGENTARPVGASRESAE